MPTPATIWIAVIALAAVLLIVKEIMKRPRISMAGLSHKLRHLFSVGPSREEFFCPGDKEAWEDGDE